MDIDRWGRSGLGTVLSKTISRVLGEFLAKGFSMTEFTSVFRDEAGASADWPVPPLDVLPETLDQAAEALRESFAARPDEELPRAWAASVAERLIVNATPVLSRRELVTPEKAGVIRVAALCLAGEADALERTDIGDQFRGIAAGITWLEGLSSRYR
jgi:hypothetical protein